MLSDLVVIHVNRSTGNPITRSPLGLHWSTCLRQLTLLNGAEYSLIRGMTRDGHEVLRGHEAYRFLLEVVCGLHSAMIGETQVMGQFREFCLKADYPDTPWGNFLRQFNQDLLVDAKRIRNQHLHNLGSQSYGSLAHRYLKNLSAVTILGAGKLVKEILPWLAGQTELTVVNRHGGSLEALRANYPEIRIAELGSAELGISSQAGLLIAAPLSAAEIERWIARQGATFVRTLDLRGESATDPLTPTGELLDLRGFFAFLEEERSRVREISEKARQEIRRRADRHLKQVQCRPYGWEDLCA